LQPYCTCDVTERMVFLLAGLQFGLLHSIRTTTLHNSVHSMYFVCCYKAIPHQKMVHIKLTDVNAEYFFKSLICFVLNELIYDGQLTN